jgi:hypothetical protein
VVRFRFGAGFRFGLCLVVAAGAGVARSADAGPWSLGAAVAVVAEAIRVTSCCWAAPHPLAPVATTAAVTAAVTSPRMLGRHNRPVPVSTGRTGTGRPCRGARHAGSGCPSDGGDHPRGAGGQLDGGLKRLIGTKSNTTAHALVAVIVPHQPFRRGPGDG